MDTFSYLSVLFSVILGLAVTEILQGFRRFIVARHQVTVYPPILVWMGVVLLVVVQDWWASARCWVGFAYRALFRRGAGAGCSRRGTAGSR